MMWQKPERLRKDKPVHKQTDKKLMTKNNVIETIESLSSSLLNITETFLTISSLYAVTLTF